MSSPSSAVPLAQGSAVGTWTLGQELAPGADASTTPGGESQGDTTRTFLARGRGRQEAIVKVHPEAAAAAMRNEADALRCLDHPAFPRILDEGSSPLPWLACSFIPGRTLAEGLPPGTLEAGPALPLLARVLAALAHAHSRGILHGDVRPENILLTPGGDVVLLDLGLSGRVGTEGTHGGTLTGTPAYLAPEQLAGAAASPSTEVYSACAVFLEALAGTASLAKLRARGELARAMPGGLPASLAALVAQGLAHDPASRPPHAGAALALLLPGVPPSDPHLPSLRLAATLRPAAAGSVAEPPLVGREAAVSQLSQLVEATAAGRGGVAVVTAEAGLGKSRLLRELERHGERLGVRVLSARCRESMPGQAGPWRDLLAPLAAELSLRGASDVAALANADARALGYVCPEMLEIPYVRSLPDPADLSPDLNKFRVFSAVTALLRNWSRAEPLLILLDDAHFADAATVELAWYLQRNVVHGASTLGEDRAGGALSIVLARRPAQAGEGELLDRTLVESRRTGLHADVTPGRLGPDHVRELVRGMLPGGPVPQALSDLVAAEAGGSPQLAVDLVTALDGDGLLRFSRGAWHLTGGDESVAGRFADLLRRRTLGLGADARRLLSAAALLGPEFDALLAASTAGLDGAAGSSPRALAELVATRLVLPSGRGRHALVHDQLRRLVLDDLDPGERVSLHARAAAALEASGAAGAAEIARHLLAAGDTDGALRVLPLAAQECRLAGSSAEALALLREAIALHDTLPREQRLVRLAAVLAARQSLAEILLRSGRRAEASDAFLDLLGACRGAGAAEAEARALVGLGMTSNLSAAYEDGRQHLERALAVAAAHDLPDVEVAARVYLIQNAYMQGRFDAGEVHERPVTLALESLTDRALRAEALRQLGLFHHFRGRSDEAIPLYREALRLLTDLGDRRNTAATLHNLGILHNARGEYHVALDCYERSLGIFRELGLSLETAACLTNVGNVHLQQGALAEAERRYLEAQRIQARVGDRRAEAENLSNLADVDMRRGAYHRARDRHRDALAVHRDLGNRAGIAFAAGSLAVSLLELGQVEAARPLVTEALDLDRELESARGLAYDHAAAALLAERTGDDLAALLDLETAGRAARSAGDRYHATILANATAALEARLQRPGAEPSARHALLEATSLGAREEEVHALLTIAEVARSAEVARDHVARALELASRLESPTTQWRAQRVAARVRAAQGDLAGALAAMDRAAELVASLGRRLGDDGASFLARRDVTAFFGEMLALEQSAGPRIDALLSRHHLLATEDLRVLARGLVARAAAGLPSAAASGEVRRLRAFHEVVTGADLSAPGGLLTAFLQRVIELVDAERGLLYLVRGQQLECRLALATGGATLATAERDVPRQVVERVLRERRGLVVEDAPADARIDYRRSIASLRVKSLLAAPLLDEGGQCVGVLYVDRRGSGTSFDEAARTDFEATCLDLARLVKSVTAAEERDTEVKALRDRLAATSAEGLPGIIGTSLVMRSLAATTRIVAATSESVLVTGPSGSGKEVLARALHDGSPRAAAPFVALDCGAVPDTLAESVLFGHVKGAFTGADRDRAGVFEEANGGTLFLDEVTNASRDVQARLLRVLQEREVRRVGGRGTIPVDVRVVAATNVDLDAAVAGGAFREDLYYRLNVIQLAMPPLAARREDVPLLAEHFLRQVATRDGKDLEGFTEEALRLLAAHDWPGNVRELSNCVARMAAFCTEGRVGADRIPERVRQGASAGSLDLAHGEAATTSASGGHGSAFASGTAALVEALIAGEQDFWAAVREPLRARAITKEDARAIIAEGLRRSRGSYKKAATLFGLPEAEYSRFMDFLRFNDLKLDFREFRTRS